MGKSIVLNFPPKIPREVRNNLTELANSKIAGINDDVNNWNGFIDVIKDCNGEFSFIAKCDQEEVRGKMQALLEQG